MSNPTKSTDPRSSETEVVKTRELANLLEVSKSLTLRLNKIDERLGMMNGRLSGDVLGGMAAEGDDPPKAGIIGEFRTTNNVIYGYIDSIEEWITSIERIA